SDDRGAGVVADITRHLAPRPRPGQAEVGAILARWCRAWTGLSHAARHSGYGRRTGERPAVGEPPKEGAGAAAGSDAGRSCPVRTAHHRFQPDHARLALLFEADLSVLGL